MKRGLGAREPQLVSPPAALLARSGLGVPIAAPFVRAIGAALAGIEKAEEEPKSREFMLRVRKMRKIKLCLHWSLRVTQRTSPTTLPSIGTFSAASRSALHTRCLPNRPLSPPPPFWPPRKLHQWFVLTTCRPAPSLSARNRVV